MKKYLSLLLLLTLLLSLIAGCAAEQTSTQPPATDDPIVSDTPVDEPAETPETPADEPEAPADEPEAPADEPEAPAEEPKAPADEPENEPAIELNSWGLPAGFAEGTMPYPICEPGEITLTRWASAGNTLLQQEDWWLENNIAYNKAAERTGITIEWNFFSGQNYATNYSMMLIAEEYPDMAISQTTSYTGGVDKAIEDDVWVNLAPYLEEYAPNFLRWVNLTEANRKSAYTDEGNLAFMGLVYDRLQPQFLGAAIRQNWLDDLGLEMPEHVDEWHDVLVAFRDNKTNGVGPLDIGPNGFMTDMTILEGAFNITAKSCGLICKDDVIESSWRSEGLYDYLEMMQGWYAEGLVNPDFVTFNAWTGGPERIASNGCGITHLMYSQAGDFHANAHIAEPGTYFELMPMPTIEGIERKVYNHGKYSSPVSGTMGTTIFTTSEYITEAIRWLDYWYSEEGYTLTNYGIEGETYTVNEDGIPIQTELFTNNPDGLSVGDAQGMYLDHNNFVFIVDRNDRNAPEAGQKYSTLWYNIGEWTLSGNLTQTAEEGEALGTKATDIDTYFTEFCAKVITGEYELNDESWTEFQNQLTVMGLDEVIELKQAAYDRFLAR